MIMLETTPRRLTRLTRIAMLGCGALLLPALPSLAQDKANHENHIHEIHKQLAELEAQQAALDKFKADISSLEHRIHQLKEHGDLAKAKQLEAELSKQLDAHNAQVARRNHEHQLLQQHKHDVTRLKHAKSLDADITKLSQEAARLSNLGRMQEAHELLTRINRLESDKVTFHNLLEAREAERQSAVERQRLHDNERLVNELTRNKQHIAQLEALLDAQRAKHTSQNPLARVAEIQKASKELEVLHKTMALLHEHGLHQAAAELHKASRALAQRIHAAEGQRKSALEVDLSKQELDAARREQNRAATRQADQGDRIRQLELRMEEMASMIAALRAELAKSRRKL